MSVDSVHSDTVHVPFLQSMQAQLWFIHILLPDCVIFPRRSISIPDEVCISIEFPLSGHTRGSLPSSSHPSSYRSRSSPEDPLPPTLPHRCSHPHQDAALRGSGPSRSRHRSSHHKMPPWCSRSSGTPDFHCGIPSPPQAPGLHTQASAHPGRQAFPPGSQG